MIKLSIAAANAETVKKGYTIEEKTSTRGYDKKFEARDNYGGSTYEIEILTGSFYILKAEDYTTTYYIKFTNATDNTIIIDSAELYTKGSNQPTRREKSDKYLKKYKYMACLVHAVLLTNGLTENNEQSEPAQPKPTRVRYTIKKYLCDSGVMRVTFTRNNSKFVTIDAPAADLEAIKAEIITSEPGAVFIQAGEALTA